MSDERKKARVWPWIVALLIGLPVLYMASFGPACWLSTEAEQSSATRGHYYKVAPRAYGPFGWLLMRSHQHGPAELYDFINWYATLGTPRVLVPVWFSEIQQFGCLRAGFNSH